MLRRMAWWLALVLVLAVTLGGCSQEGKPTASGGQQVAQNQEASKAESQPPISPEPKQDKVTLTLYFADDQAMNVVPEERTVDKGNGNLEQLIVTELLRGPQLDPTLRATLPQGTRLLSVETRDGICYVNFSKEVQTKHWGGSAGESMTIQSVVNSLTELPNVKAVQFLLEGKKEESIWGHGITSEPIERHITTGSIYNSPERLKWLQEDRVNKGLDKWRLDPLQVAKREGGIAGFLKTDVMKLITTGASGKEVTGQAAVEVTHEGAEYRITLTQFGGPDPNHIWVIDAVEKA